jgi:hypothetical protein
MTMSRAARMVQAMITFRSYLRDRLFGDWERRFRTV